MEKKKTKILFLIILVCMLFLFNNGYIVIPFLVFYVGIAIYSNLFNEFKKEHKKFITKLVTLINKDLEYKPTEKELWYKEKFIDNKSYLKVCLSHYLGTTDTFWLPILMEIDIKVKSNNEIKDRLEIVKNKTKNNLGDSNMIDEEFREYFKVYSNDETTKNLLTDYLMKILIDFRKKYKIDYNIIFENNTINLTFFTRTIIKPGGYRKSRNKQLLFNYYCVLKIIIEFTKEINGIIEETL